MRSVRSERSIRDDRSVRSERSDRSVRSEERYDKVISHINETKEECVNGLKSPALMYETLKEEVVNSKKMSSGNPNDDPDQPDGGGEPAALRPSGGIRSRAEKLQKQLPK